MPSSSRAASDIMPGFQGGSKTIFDHGFANARQRLDLRLRVGGEHAAHAATGSRQRELHLCSMTSAFERSDGALVDETEVDDVDRDLGVVAGAKLVPNELLEVFRFLRRRCRGRGRRAALHAHGVRVLAGDANHVAVVGRHRVGVAERLRDHHQSAGGQHHLGAARDLDRLAIARQRDRFVSLHASHLTRWSPCRPCLPAPRAACARRGSRTSRARETRARRRTPRACRASPGSARSSVVTSR